MVLIKFHVSKVPVVSYLVLVSTHNNIDVEKKWYQTSLKEVPKMETLVSVYSRFDILLAPVWFKFFKPLKDKQKKFKAICSPQSNYTGTPKKRQKHE